MSYYGYGSATGRMSPAESWNQMYLGGDVWTGAREIDPELRSMIREFEGLQWSELPVDIQELWKQMGNYRPSGESIATESQKLECPNCGRNNGMWTLDDGSGDDFVCVWCNRGTTIEKVTELNNLSQAEVFNIVMEDERNPKTYDFWNAGESKEDDDLDEYGRNVNQDESSILDLFKDNVPKSKEGIDKSQPFIPTRASDCPFNPDGRNHEFIKDQNSDVTCKHCGEEVTDYEVKLWGESKASEGGFENPMTDEDWKRLVEHYEDWKKIDQVYPTRNDFMEYVEIKGFNSHQQQEQAIAVYDYYTNSGGESKASEDYVGKCKRCGQTKELTSTAGTWRNALSDQQYPDGNIPSPTCEDCYYDIYGEPDFVEESIATEGSGCSNCWGDGKVEMEDGTMEICSDCRGTGLENPYEAMESKANEGYVVFTSDGITQERHKEEWEAKDHAELIGGYVQKEISNDDWDLGKHYSISRDGDLGDIVYDARESKATELSPEAQCPKCGSYKTILEGKSSLGYGKRRQYVCTNCYNVFQSEHSPKEIKAMYRDGTSPYDRNRYWGEAKATEQQSVKSSQVFKNYNYPDGLTRNEITGLPLKSAQCKICGQELTIDNDIFAEKHLEDEHGFKIVYGESKATEVSVFDWWDKVTHDGSDIARQWEGTHFNELPIGRQNHYFNIYMEELGADKYGDHEIFHNSTDFQDPAMYKGSGLDGWNINEPTSNIEQSYSNSWGESKYTIEGDFDESDQNDGEIQEKYVRGYEHDWKDKLDTWDGRAVSDNFTTVQPYDPVNPKYECIYCNKEFSWDDTFTHDGSHGTLPSPYEDMGNT